MALLIITGIIELIVFFVVLDITSRISYNTYEYVTKDYDTLDVSEEQYLWDTLYSYFEGDEIAVLSVMCNLYAQYTSYENKEKLYSYAKLWFSKGGQGEDYRFNIADPKM